MTLLGIFVRPVHDARSDAEPATVERAARELEGHDAA
jgi:hypothetical protein